MTRIEIVTKDGREQKDIIELILEVGSKEYSFRCLDGVAFVDAIVDDRWVFLFEKKFNVKYSKAKKGA